MKTKCIIVLFFALLNVYLHSFASTSRTNEMNYCDFQGVLDRSAMTLQEEFAMLLNPIWTPNFETIAMAIALLAITPPEDLNNQQCSVYKYAREFLDYYNQNKESITEDKLHITKLLDAIQERINEADVPKPKRWWSF